LSRGKSVRYFGLCTLL